METLHDIRQKLAAFFALDQPDRDPAFSRFIPMVYEPVRLDWKRLFESDFVRRFNGLMIAESRGAQAYIAGEIHCHIDNDRGRSKYAAVMDYVFDTGMSLIGVSYAASEFLVMKTQMKDWIRQQFRVYHTRS